MVRTNVEQIRSTLAYAVGPILNVRVEQKDEAVSAFNTFRLAVMQTSTVDDSIRGDLLESLDFKSQILGFLIEFYGQKRTYKRQVASVLDVLLRSESWLKALHDDTDLCARLPAELRLVDKQSSHAQAVEEHHSLQPSQSHAAPALSQASHIRADEFHGMVQQEHAQKLETPSLDAPQQFLPVPESVQNLLQHPTQELVQESDMESPGAVPPHAAENLAEHENAKQQHLRISCEAAKPKRGLQLPQRPSWPPPSQPSPLKLPVALQGVWQAVKRVPSIGSSPQDHIKANFTNKNMSLWVEESAINEDPLPCERVSPEQALSPDAGRGADAGRGDQSDATKRSREMPCLPRLGSNSMSLHDAGDTCLPISAEHDLQFTPQHSPRDQATTSNDAQAQVPKRRSSRPSMVARLWEMVRRRSVGLPASHGDTFPEKLPISGVAPTDCEVRAAVKAAQAQAAAKCTAPSSYQQLREEPEVELDNAMALIQKCTHSTDFDDQIAAFQAFHRFVSKTSGACCNMDTAIEKLIKDIQPKSSVLNFLVGIYEQRKMQRKRVCSALKLILRYPQWQSALAADKELCGRLPPDLQLIAQSHSLLPVPTRGHDAAPRFQAEEEEADAAQNLTPRGAERIGVYAAAEIAERCCSPQKRKRSQQDSGLENSDNNSSGTRSNGSWYSRAVAFMSAFKVHD